MIKKNRKVLLITSLVILLPILAGVILWSRLPEQIPMHWNIRGEVDGWSHKGFVVFGMPVIFLAFHWGCALATAADPKRAAHSAKVQHLVLWMIPAINLVISIVTYLTALEIPVRVDMVIPVLMGLIFVIIGNYLPKCKQNYTIGIKIAWTLNSEENWNRTHRFAGWLWVAGGFAMMAAGVFVGFWAEFAVMLPMAVAPVVYSYILHRKGV